MVQDNSQEVRKSFLLTLLSNAEIVGEKQRAAKLKAIQQAEYMKKLWPKLQKYAKGGDNMLVDLPASLSPQVYS